MKQKHTKARKARRKNNAKPYWKFNYNASVLERHKVGAFGADCREFAAKHPTL